MPYSDQLARKRDALRSLLERSLRRAAPAVEPAIGMATPGGQGPWGFRHKASFVFGPDPRERGGIVMGHYEAGSRRIVPVVESPVHAPRANRIAFALRDRLARAGISAAGPALDGLLRHVVIRTSRDEREAVAMLVVTRNEKALRAPLRALLGSGERADGLYVSIHAKPGPYMVGDETKHIDGRTHVRESCGGASFLVSPTAFFQTNPAAADVLVRLVLEAVADVAPAGGGRVLDLYAGSGLFAVPLAMAGHVVTAVEENRQAVKDGEANVRLNGVPRERLRWVAGRVERWGRHESGQAPRFVVLDPPRQGCPQAVLDAVFRRLAPPRAVYVSCNPETLAQELPSIVDAGYAISRVQPVDMFPHTEHIETVVTLDRTAAATGSSTAARTGPSTAAETRGQRPRRRNR